MLQHIEQKTMPYTPEQMYNLVVEVDKYNEFLPWCVASRINKRESESIFYADLIVGYKMIRERFASRVIVDPHEHIHIEYLRGPLKHLQNHWHFNDDGQGGCVIDFSVAFEFRNFMLQGMAQMFFQQVVSRMVSAFESRAKDLYD